MDVNNPVEKRKSRSGVQPLRRYVRAGAVGFEPTTDGFGDRYADRYTTPPDRFALTLLGIVA